MIPVSFFRSNETPPLPPLSDHIAFYTGVNGPSGTDYLADESFNSYEAYSQYLGTCSVCGIDGGPAFDVNGIIPARIIIPSIRGPIDAASNFSISLWWKSSIATQLGGVGLFSIQGDDMLLGGVSVGAWDGDIVVEIVTFGGTIVQYNTGVSIQTGAGVGDWKNLVCNISMASGQPIQIWVDGVMTNDTLSSTSGTIPLDDVYMGGSHKNSRWDTYTGFLDQYRILDRHVTASEVAGLYAEKTI